MLKLRLRSADLNAAPFLVPSALRTLYSSSRKQKEVVSTYEKRRELLPASAVWLTALVVSSSIAGVCSEGGRVLAELACEGAPVQKASGYWLFAARAGCDTMLFLRQPARDLTCAAVMQAAWL